MKVSIRVENHQPVPMQPFVDLIGEARRGGTVVVYMGVRKWCNGYEGEEYDGDGKELTTHIGWCLWDGEAFTHIESGWWFDMDDFDEERTLGRLLQPGEKLVVEYEV